MFVVIFSLMIQAYKTLRQIKTFWESDFQHFSICSNKFVEPKVIRKTEPNYFLLANKTFPTKLSMRYIHEITFYWNSCFYYCHNPRALSFVPFQFRKLSSATFNLFTRTFSVARSLNEESVWRKQIACVKTNTPQKFSVLNYL